MTEQHVATLSERLGINEPPATGGERVFVQGFFWGGGELPGWRPARLDRHATAAPPATLALWSPADREGDVDVMVKVETFELDGAREAHAELLRVLSGFMSPNLERDSNLGEQAVRGGDTVVVALRGNVVFLVRNAGRQVVPVVELAARVDDHLSGARSSPSEQGADLLRAEATREANGYRLEVTPADALGDAVWLRFTSTTGAVHREDGRLLFLPDQPGSHDLLVAAVGPRGVAAVRRLTVRGTVGPSDQDAVVTSR